MLFDMATEFLWHWKLFYQTHVHSLSVCSSSISLLMALQDSSHGAAASRERPAGWCWGNRQAESHQTCLAHVRLPVLPNRAHQRLQLWLISRGSEETLHHDWSSGEEYSLPLHWYTGTYTCAYIHVHTYMYLVSPPGIKKGKESDHIHVITSFLPHCVLVE